MTHNSKLAYSYVLGRNKKHVRFGSAARPYPQKNPKFYEAAWRKGTDDPVSKERTSYIKMQKSRLIVEIHPYELKNLQILWDMHSRNITFNKILQDSFS